MGSLKVSAIIVTRGDVALDPIIATIPADWELIVWDNSVPSVKVVGLCEFTLPSIKDLSVYGRYAAIKHASHDLIYVQDDDCIVSDPQAIVSEWLRGANFKTGTPVIGEPQFPVLPGIAGRDVLVANMPANFRHAFYQEHGLVGFGACFHRDAPVRAFGRLPYLFVGDEIGWFQRTCDIVFTALTPRVLVDVPYEDLPWASAPNRMWQQEGHREERQRMLDLVLKVRDA